jgi:hypothetical protein
LQRVGILETPVLQAFQWRPLEIVSSGSTRFYTLFVLLLKTQGEWHRVFTGDPHVRRRWTKRFASLVFRSLTFNGIRATEKGFLSFAAISPTSHFQQLPAAKLGKPFSVLGFALAIAGALSRSYRWGRLREAGVVVPRWWTVADDIRAGEKYFRLAKTKTIPVWPLVLTAAGLPAGFSYGGGNIPRLELRNEGQQAPNHGYWEPGISTAAIARPAGPLIQVELAE